MSVTNQNVSFRIVGSNVASNNDCQDSSASTGRVEFYKPRPEYSNLYPPKEISAVALTKNDGSVRFVFQKTDEYVQGRLKVITPSPTTYGYSFVPKDHFIKSKL